MGYTFYLVIDSIAWILKIFNDTRVKMNDILFDKRVNKNHLQMELHDPSCILSVLASFDEAILLLDNKLIISYVNNKANTIIKKITGKYFEAGESILDLLKETQQLGLQKNLNEVLSGKTIHCEIEIKKNDRSMWLECSYKPLQTEQGIIGVCALFKDVSRIKGLVEEESKK
jgi:sensor histidine kinase regulating citrate/malate metabolism